MSAALETQPGQVPGRVIAIASARGRGQDLAVDHLAAGTGAGGRRVVLMDARSRARECGCATRLKAGTDLGRCWRYGAGTGGDTAARGLSPAAGPVGDRRPGGLSGAALEAATALPRRLAAGWQEVGGGYRRGGGGTTAPLAARADLLLLVATEEPTSLTDAYAVLKLHAQDAPGGDARLVVNLAASAASGQATHATLDAAARRFLGRALPLAGIIRRDSKVPDAIRHQTPLLTRHPGSAAARDVAALARALG